MRYSHAVEAYSFTVGVSAPLRRSLVAEENHSNKWHGAVALSRHAGRQTGGWAFGFKTLYAKLGSSRRFSDFARDLRWIAANNHQPEYHLTIYDDARGDPCLHAVRRTLLAPGHQTHHPELLQDLGKRRTRARF